MILVTLPNRKHEAVPVVTSSLVTETTVENETERNGKKERKDKDRVRNIATEDSPPGENSTQKTQRNSEHKKVISWKDIVIGKQEDSKEGEN